MSVKRCQQEIDSAEFSEWIAYNNKHPFLIDRSEYMLAILCALTANIHSKNKKFTYEDFLLQTEVKIQDSKTMEKTLEAIYGSNFKS